VELDEKDTGIRAILNFGHTFGHAAEKLENYTGITHGSAVAAGMIYAARLGEFLDVTPKGTASSLSAIVKRFHLPDSFAHESEDLFKAAISDKKNLSGKIGIILLSEMGKAFVNPMHIADLGDAMKRMGS
jgi:3-dehydroquinate synthase